MKEGLQRHLQIGFGENLEGSGNPTAVRNTDQGGRRKLLAQIIVIKSSDAIFPNTLKELHRRD